MHPDFGAPGCAAGTAATPSSPCFRSCSHPPAVSAGKLCKTKSSTHFHTLNFFGGRGWIRTTEAESSRFTVCPHWPLGKAPIFICVPPCLPATYVIIAKGISNCKPFFDFFLDFFKKVCFCRCTVQIIFLTYGFG